MLWKSTDLMKENGFKLANDKSRRYPAQTITDADDDDDISIIVNTPTQAESLLQCLQRTAGGICLHLNTNKTEYMSFNEGDDISTLKGELLKVEDMFTYLGSSVSST